jgi:hypothetical protein
MVEGQNNSDMIIFQTEDGQIRVEVLLDGETVWLSQKLIAALYQKSIPTINEHIKNIYAEGELEPEATLRNFRIVQMEGAREVERQIDHYNLEVIIAVGYRVRSHRGTQFRRWATERLREYLVKGFVMDDVRLKEGRGFAGDYFDELLERIRDIRASEKRFYKKITDIYSLSVDYDPQAAVSRQFFATVQNKLHWAIHGHTAAELISERADAQKPNMGLTNWQGGKVRKKDVSVAKNYLNEAELRSLNRIVTMYLDYAEDQAERRQTMTMQDWAEKLDTFLQFNERAVLENAGTVTHAVAKSLAEAEYETFNRERLAAEAQQPDDFDRFVKQLAAENKSEEDEDDGQEGRA